MDYNATLKCHEEIDREACSFELPDGQIIRVDTQVRMGAPEILFSGEGGEASMQQLCMKAMNTCDEDFQQDLVRGLVVAGGTSMLPGIAPRLKADLSRLLPADMAQHLEVCADSQRKYSAWIGGSMFASLSTFNQVAISREEYENGKSDVRSLISRKSF